MAWYDTLADVINKLNPTDAGNLLDHITNSNEMVAQVNALLLQVQRDPASASTVATQIISIRGVPSVVRDLAGNLPAAAANPVTLTMLVSQIQSALPRSRWF